MTTSSPKGIAVVTGASFGIGAIYANRLASRGYDLILVARNQAQLNKVAQRIAGTTSRSVRVIAADLSHKADLKRIESALRADGGQIAPVIRPFTKGGCHADRHHRVARGRVRSGPLVCGPRREGVAHRWRQPTSGSTSCISRRLPHSS